LHLLVLRQSFKGKVAGFGLCESYKSRRDAASSLMRLLLFLLCLFPLLLNCGLQEDAGFAVVRELRVADVIVEPAEPSPGEPALVRAVAVDPESRELAYLWFVPPEVVDPKAGIPEGMEPIAFTPQFLWNAPPAEGEQTLIVFVVPAEFLPELAEFQDFNALRNIPHAIAFKNINVSSSEVKNHNPVIEDIAIEPVVFNAEDKVTLTAIADDPDGDELQIAWLSITPGLSSDYENPVEFKIPEDGSPATIYLVVRDNRGGSALRMIELK
jgi:hypothetical protein